MSIFIQPKAIEQLALNCKSTGNDEAFRYEKDDEYSVQRLLKKLNRRKNRPKVLCLNEDAVSCAKWILFNPLGIEGSFDIAGYEKRCNEEKGKRVEANYENYRSYITFTCVDE